MNEETKLVQAYIEVTEAKFSAIKSVLFPEQLNAYNSILVEKKRILNQLHPEWTESQRALLDLF